MPVDCLLKYLVIVISFPTHSRYKSARGRFCTEDDPKLFSFFHEYIPQFPRVIF